MRKITYVNKLKGFSLIEILVAFILFVGVILSLSSFFAVGILRAKHLQQVTISKNLATTILDNIIASYQRGLINFDSISEHKNQENGILLSGKQPIRNPGNDQIYYTSDDKDDFKYTLGPDLQTDKSGSSQETNLTTARYEYQIIITSLPTQDNTKLKQIIVEVFYPQPIGTQQSFKLLTILGNYQLSHQEKK